MGRPPKKETMMSNDSKASAEDPTLTMSEAAFQAAVQAELQRQLPHILAAMAKAPSAAPAGTETISLAREIALAIAEIGDQGTGRKRLPPAVLAAREEAKGNMIAAIMKFRSDLRIARKNRDRYGMDVNHPKYQVMRQMYLNDEIVNPFYIDEETKVPKPSIIRWSGAPNPNMEPMNDSADIIMRHYRDWIGETTEGRVDKEVWMSAKGLLIEGANLPEKHKLVSKKFADELSVGEDVELPGEEGAEYDEDGEPVQRFNAHDITKKTVNIMGTIAPPAIQSGARHVRVAHAAERG